MLSNTPNNLDGYNRLVGKLEELMKHQKCHVHGGAGPEEMLNPDCRRRGYAASLADVGERTGYH